MAQLNKIIERHILPDGYALTSAAESPQGCWSSWVYSDESVRLPERFLEAAESSTS